MSSIGHKFKMHGRSDLDYVMNPGDCRSISGGRVLVSSILVVFCSVTQKFVVLFVAELEIAARVMVPNIMLSVYHLLELLRLKIGEENLGAVEITNSWSVVGCTCHVDVKNYILCKLMDQGLLCIKYITGDSNGADTLLRN